MLLDQLLVFHHTAYTALVEVLVYVGKTDASHSILIPLQNLGHTVNGQCFRSKISFYNNAIVFLKLANQKMLLRG